MLRRPGLCLLIVLLAPARGSAEEAPAQWVVVMTPESSDAVAPLAEHRRAQGMKVRVVETTGVLSAAEIAAGDAAKLRDRIHQLCREHKGPSYVLLVGAVMERLKKGGGREGAVVPPLHGTISRMKGQVTDNGYGCPNGGLLPTVAVGRFPAGDAEEVRVMVQKTLAFERDTRPGQWRRRLTLLMGHPGGGSATERAFAERYVEGACLARTDRLHPSWTARALLHLPQSRFGFSDDKLRERALDYLADGQAFTVYAGHSSAEGFWSEGAKFLDRGDWGRLTMGRGPGILVTCGCFGCQYSGSDGEGYGQIAFRNPTGPVAVIGAHGESYAAMGQLAFDGLLNSLSAERLPERLGDCWLGVAAGIAKGPMDVFTFKLLDQADGSRGKVPLAAQRQEHLEMWLLLGDPALRLPNLPLDVKLQTAGDVVPGQPLTVRGEVPARLAGARVRVTLERPLSSTPADLEPLLKDAAARTRTMRANHERANYLVLASQEVTVRDGRFEARLDVPAKVPSPRLTVRAYAATEQQDGLGVLSLTIPE